MYPTVIDLGVFDPQELVVLLVALGGLVPVILYYQETSRWFVIAYGFLLVGAITTNVERVLWPDVVNLVEHLVGNMGAGVAFAVAAYKQHKTFRRSTEGNQTAEQE